MSRGCERRPAGTLSEVPAVSPYAPDLTGSPGDVHRGRRPLPRRGDVHAARRARRQLIRRTIQYVANARSATARTTRMPVSMLCSGQNWLPEW